MSTPERIYALLVEANPVPDPEELLIATRLRETQPRRQTMQTEETIRVMEPPPPRRRRWLPAMAAGIIVAVSVAAAAIWLTAGDDEPAPVVTDPPVTTVADVVPEPDSVARAEAAVARVQGLQTALAEGDLAGVEALLSPTAPLEIAERRVWEFNAVLEAAYPSRIDGCEATSTANSLFVLVECTTVDTSPVADALGGGERTAPWRVFDDGPMEWQAFRSETLGTGAGRLAFAYAAYLSATLEDEYLASCAPSAYEPQSVIANQGLSLAAPCAELMVAVAPDVAAWIEAGRPELGAPSEEALVETARAVMAAIAAGDVDAVVALSGPEGTVREADRRMWEFLATGFAAYPIDVQRCAADSVAQGAGLRVVCRAVDSSPVAEAVGLSETDWPFIVFDDGRVLWRPTEPDVEPVPRAFTEYLRIHDPDTYEEHCSVSSGINFNGGLALTGECAAVITPLTQDVADWILAGRPQS